MSDMHDLELPIHKMVLQQLQLQKKDVLLQCMTMQPNLQWCHRSLLVLRHATSLNCIAKKGNR